MQDKTTNKQTNKQTNRLLPFFPRHVCCELGAPNSGHTALSEYSFCGSNGQLFCKTLIGSPSMLIERIFRVLKVEMLTINQELEVFLNITAALKHKNKY